MEICNHPIKKNKVVFHTHKYIDDKWCCQKGIEPIPRDPNSGIVTTQINVLVICDHCNKLLTKYEI
jgi:hypothetical protein